MARDGDARPDVAALCPLPDPELRDPAAPILAMASFSICILRKVAVDSERRIIPELKFWRSAKLCEPATLATRGSPPARDNDDDDDDDDDDEASPLRVDGADAKPPAGDLERREPKDPPDPLDPTPPLRMIDRLGSGRKVLGLAIFLCQRGLSRWRACASFSAHRGRGGSSL